MEKTRLRDTHSEKTGLYDKNLEKTGLCDIRMFEGMVLVSGKDIDFRLWVA